MEDESAGPGGWQGRTEKLRGLGYRIYVTSRGDSQGDWLMCLVGSKREFGRPQGHTACATGVEGVWLPVAEMSLWTSKFREGKLNLVLDRRYLRFF